MKNLKYFPFERNRYFYGKFLSVDDFEAEQRYMNDKRRLLNRFLHGCGVVCGLQVVQVDDLTISLEAGLALDFSGREILVPSPVTKRLSAIDGFLALEEAQQDRHQLYIGIAYEEEGVEPVHNITRINEDQEEEYNRYAETYRLFITGEEPEQEEPQISFLHEEERTIYWGSGIRIRQSVPRYIQSGKEAEITVTVEKEEESAPAVFHYELQLQLLDYQGASEISIDFDEESLEPARAYVLRRVVRAKALKDKEASVEVVGDSFTLTIGEFSKKEKISGKFRLKLTGGTVEEAVIKDYYDTSMEDVMKDPYGQVLYLAKLDVIRAGETYVIEKVENLPYRQCIWNGMLSGALESLRLKQFRLQRQALPVTEREALREADLPKPEMHTPVKNPDLPMNNPDIKTGSIVIDLGMGGVAGKKFFSEEIVHGLGLGDVFISLGLSRGIKEGNQIVYGSQDIFSEEDTHNIAMAAKVNPQKGTFVIGIRCIGFVEAKKLKICWMAYKDSRAQKDQNSQMVIRPDLVDMNVREVRYFEALIDDEVQKNVKWSIREEEGGSISPEGCYIAPNTPGVYEIRAESTDDFSGVKAVAAAYIIVRDTIS